MTRRKDMNGLPADAPVCPACFAAIGRREVGITLCAWGWSVTDGRSVAPARPFEGFAAARPGKL